MVGLLLVVGLVLVLYKILVVAIVVEGTRLWRAAAHRCAVAEAAGERSAAEAGKQQVAAMREGVPLRASDRERDMAAERIGEAMADGRLGLDEGRRRLDAACTARDRVQLEYLVRDLPPQLGPVGGAARFEPGRALRSGALIAVVGAVTVQALAGGAWVLWPVAVVLLVAIALGARQRDSSGISHQRASRLPQQSQQY